MKKILIVFGWLAFLWLISPARAQVYNPQIAYVTSAPSGACNAHGIDLLTPNGTLYTCQSGMWAAVSGGGGSVSLTGGTGISVSPNPITGTGVITNTAPGALPAGSTNCVQVTNAANTAFLCNGPVAIDTSGNISTPGTVSTGSNGGTTGKVALSGSTSGTCNLTTTATATAITPSTAAECDAGTTTLPLFKDVYIAGTSGTPGTNNFKFTGASTGGTRVVTLPDGASHAILDSINGIVKGNGSGTFSAATAGTDYVGGQASITTANVAVCVSSTGILKECTASGLFLGAERILLVTGGNTLNVGGGGGALTVMRFDTTLSHLIMPATAGLYDFGGTSSSFPGLKQVGAVLKVRLADDTADAEIDMSTTNISGSSFVFNGHTCTIVSTVVTCP